jgi:hypothetical protein
MATFSRTYEHGPWEKQDADLEAACVQAPAGEAEAVQRVLGLHKPRERKQA